MIPGLTDHEMESIMERAADGGATAAYYSTLRLLREVTDLFHEWLEALRLGRASRVMSLVRQMSNGKTYDASFGTRMRGQGPIAELLAQRFGLGPRIDKLAPAIR